MAHTVHRTAGTAVAAGSVSFFLISAELDDDQCADRDQDGCDDDGCKICCDPCEHRNTPLF